MMRRCGFVLALLLASPSSGFAQEMASSTSSTSATPVLTLLQSIEAAAHGEDYIGVFAHQHADTLASARIVHVVDGTGERERLELLDGEPREYLRHNDTSQCLMPAKRLVIRARARNDRFPAILIGDASQIDQVYQLRTEAETARVAGRACRLSHLEPRDSARYAYTLCTDTQTGLLLKVQTVDGGEILAQTAFISVTVGKDTPPTQLETTWDTSHWEVRDEATEAIDLAARGWRIPAPAGYQLVAQLQRPMRGVREVKQVVFADGLAAFSVFIEAAENSPATYGGGTLWQRGALSVHLTRTGDYGLTLLGEVPPAVLLNLAQHVQFVPPPAKPVN